MSTAVPETVIRDLEPESPPPRRLTGRRRGDALAAVLFISPGAVFFLAFIVAPAIVGLALSFFEWDLFGPAEFVGLRNFERLFGDPAMWNSLGVSGMFLLLGVAPSIVVGFLLAVLINVRMPGIGPLRVLYLTPMVASSAVTAAVWLNIFQPRGGLLNQALAWLGIQGPAWFSDPLLARPALVVVLIWGALPLVILIYIAGLQRIPDDIYAAASLDGAGRWRQVWTMTWPNVMPTTLVVLVLQIVGFLSGSFEMALLITDGGPLGTTTSLALYSYKMAFESRDIGYASALAFFQILVILALLLVFRGVSVLRRTR